MDEYEQRLRLVSVAYGVLRDIETPADKATDREMFLHLSRAFSDKATALADPRGGRKLLPVTSDPYLLF
jgi:hypothetical protein